MTALVLLAVIGPVETTAAESDGLFGSFLKQMAARRAQASDGSTTGTSSLSRARELGGEQGLREATGLGAAPAILDDPAALRELLGENPRWVWNVDPNRSRPDPMLLPWVAERLLFEARDAEAKALEGIGKLEEALDIYLALLPSVTEKNYRAQIQGRVDQLTQQIEARKAMGIVSTRPTGPATQQIVEPVLPQHVLTETRGVIYDPRGGSAVAVGNQMLRVGDKMEGFPGVVVKEIGYQTVVFSVTNEFTTKDFTVKVQGNQVILE